MRVSGGGYSSLVSSSGLCHTAFSKAEGPSRQVVLENLKFSDMSCCVCLASTCYCRALFLYCRRREFFFCFGARIILAIWFQTVCSGAWLAGAAGGGFTPHVITIAAGEVQNKKHVMIIALGSCDLLESFGELTWWPSLASQDVANKVFGFSQQGPRAVCVLSANGSISNVTLRHDSSFGGNITYEASAFLVMNNAWLSLREGRSFSVYELMICTF